MKLRTWPFRPEHITNDGEKHGGELAKLTGPGVITNEHLQGIQTRISAYLDCPTTMIEFSPEGEPVCSDLKLLDFALHPICKIFRECTSNKFCHDSHNTYAELFCKLIRSNFPTKIRNSIRDSGKIQQDIRVTGVTPPFINDGERGYLEYVCPILGYMELAFPIFLKDKVLGEEQSEDKPEDRVIAVFMVGQICLKDRLHDIKQVRKRFLDANPRCFDTYLDDHGSTPEKIRGKIADLHDEYVSKPRNVYDDDRYNELIGQASEELTKLEETLAEEMHIQRKLYCRDKVDLRTKEFRASLPQELPQNEDSLDLLWKLLEPRLDSLIEDFHVRYAIVFGIKHYTKGDIDTLEAVTPRGDIPSDMERVLGSLKFNLNKIPEDARIGFVTSAQKEVLFKGFEEFEDIFNQDTNLIRLYPLPFFPRVSIFVLVGYLADNPRTGIENRLNGYLDRYIISFYNTVLSTLSAILFANEQKLMEITLRILGHESGQLTSGFTWLNDMWLSDVDKLRKMTKKKTQDVFGDIDGYLRQLSSLSEKVKLLVSKPEPKGQTHFWAYSELLFKWINTYRLEVDRKRLQFIAAATYKADPYRPQIYGDQELLEQVLYNLVHNAVKYCYRGTNIYLDCRKLDLGPQIPHTLYVTNYGPEIEEGHRPYELYYRGQNTHQEEGLGIGMYIAEQIALAHNGSIRHSCTRVSEFNVPLIGPYLQPGFRAEDKGSYQQIREQLGRLIEEGELDLFQKDVVLIEPLTDELDKLKHSGMYEDIIALDENSKMRSYNPTPQEVIDSISIPTYRVTFEVTIPSKEGQE